MKKHLIPLIGVFFFINLILIIGIYFEYLQNWNFVSIVYAIFICIYWGNDEKGIIKTLFLLFAGSFLFYFEARSVILGLFLGILFIYYPVIGKILMGGLITLFFYLQHIDFFNPKKPVFLYKGKAFEQGRVEIWGKVLNTMSLQDHIWGLGGGIDYVSIIESKLSIHSGYLYIYTSYGMIGLLIMLIVFFQVWKRYKKHSKQALLIFYLIMFREFFELSLVTNNFVVEFVFWTIVLGILSSKKRKILIT